MDTLAQVHEKLDFSPNTNEAKRVNECDSISSASRSVSVNSTPMVKVYLRLRPNSMKDIAEEDEDVYIVLNPTTLLTKSPFLDCKTRMSKLTKSTENNKKKFTFTRIFDGTTSQVDFFDQCIRHQIINFLLGKSLTIMSYGTSNAGKTYTLYGTSTSPGIIPRSIELIFSAINCTLAPWYKCTYGNNVISLDEVARAQEIQNKIMIVSSKTIDKNQCAEARLSLENSISHLTDSETRDDCSSEVMSSVWISIAEIYNENVYDLLTVNDEERNVPLKLVTDKEGTTYAKGLKSVYVTTALQACQILISAQSRMSVVPTVLNPKSSRSHTIITIKLLKYRTENALDEVQVDTLTFCDLAGSGGLRKSQDVGVRLTEARSINNSLLVLGRCVKAVCDGYSMKQNVDQVVGPFRESKLTRLFQKPLSGQEDICFIVNVDPATEFFTETQSVLNFAAIAKRRVMVEPLKELKETFFSEISLQSPKMSSTWDVVTLPSFGETPEKSSSIDPIEHKVLKEQNGRLLKELEALKSRITNEEIDDSHLKSHSSNVIEYNNLLSEDEYKNLQDENKRLKEKIEAYENKSLSREFELRRELANQYSNIIEELEISWKKRTQEIEDEGYDLLKWSVNQIETFYKERIDNIMYSRKRKRIDHGDYDNENRAFYEELKAENAQVTSKVVVLRDMVKKLKNENERISTEGNKHNFELTLVKRELREFQELANTFISQLIPVDEDDKHHSSCLVDRLRKAIDINIENTETLKKQLNEERNNYVRISSSAIKTEQELSNVKTLLEKSMVKVGELEQQLFEKDRYIHTLEFQLQTPENQFLEIQNRNECEEKNLTGHNAISRHNLKCSLDSSSGYYQKYSPCTYNKSKLHLDANIRNSKEEYFPDVNDDFFCIDDTLDTGLITQAHVDIRTSLNISDTDRRSYLESTASADRSTFRSSDGSIKEDSGIGIGSSTRSRWSTNTIGNTRIPDTEEKDTQTYFHCDEKDKAMQELKIDYTNLKTQHLQDTLRVAELSEELESIRQIMSTLKEVADGNESKVIEQKEKLSYQDVQLERLAKENNKLTVKCNEAMETAHRTAEDYKNQCKRLEECMEKNQKLEDRVFLLRMELEKSSVKCGNEHISKIETLEKELLEKTLQLHEIDGRVVEMQQDFLRIHELYEKVSEFESTFEKCQNERDDSRKKLQERAEMQTALEKELQVLCRKTQEKETQINALKAEIANIMRMNVANSEKSKNLSKEIVELNQSVRMMKGELLHSQELRRDIEENSKKEILNLKSRLAVFEKNTGLFTRVTDNDDAQQEIDRLKLQLRQKEVEMSLFQRNRDTTIEKYESLVKQLQAENENRKDRLRKLEEIFMPSSKDLSKYTGKRAISKVSDSINKFSQIQGLIKGKSCNWKSIQLSKDFNKEESVSLIPSLSSLKESSSQVFDTSSFSEDCTKYCNTEEVDVGNKCENPVASQTESSSQLDESDCQTQSEISDHSAEHCPCSISYTCTEGNKKMSGWMKVRRIDAKTKLLHHTDDTYDNFNLSETESEGSDCCNLSQDRK